MKIGLCGGTFDPFHRGHLDPVLAARESLGWDRIIYIPAYVQPFKQDDAKTSPYHRFAMTVLATESVDDVFVSTDELERGAVSYTVDTLELVRSRNPGATIDWIIGDDNLGQLLEWRGVDRLFELANFVVLTRITGGGVESTPARAEARTHIEATPEPLRERIAPPQARSTHGSIVFARNATVPVSSTGIRERVRAGESIDAFVHPRVSRYIQRYRLYREGPQ